MTEGNVHLLERSSTFLTQADRSRPAFAAEAEMYHMDEAIKDAAALNEKTVCARSETPQKPIAWRWRIVSTDEIPWLYATEKPNNLNDELFWDVEPLFAASVPSAIGRREADLKSALLELYTLCTDMGWHAPDNRYHTITRAAELIK